MSHLWLLSLYSDIFVIVTLYTCEFRRQQQSDGTNNGTEHIFHSTIKRNPIKIFDILFLFFPFMCSVCSARGLDGQTGCAMLAWGFYADRVMCEKYATLCMFSNPYWLVALGDFDVCWFLVIVLCCMQNMQCTFEEFTRLLYFFIALVTLWWVIWWGSIVLPDNFFIIPLKVKDSMSIHQPSIPPTYRGQS